MRLGSQQGDVKPYRLLAFLASAVITFAFILIMIANDISVTQAATGSALADAIADAQPIGD